MGLAKQHVAFCAIHLVLVCLTGCTSIKGKHHRWYEARPAVVVRSDYQIKTYLANTRQSSNYLLERGDKPQLVRVDICPRSTDEPIQYILRPDSVKVALTDTTAAAPFVVDSASTEETCRKYYAHIDLNQIKDPQLGWLYSRYRKLMVYASHVEPETYSIVGSEMIQLDLVRAGTSGTHPHTFKKK